MSGSDKFHEDCCCGEFRVFLLRANLVTFSRFYTKTSRIPTVTGTIPVAFVLQEFFQCMLHNFHKIYVFIMYLVLIIPRNIGNAINREFYFDHISPCVISVEELDLKSRLLLTSINITIIQSPKYK